MRSESETDLRTSKKISANLDIIQQTRKIVRDMTQKQRFQKAKTHLEDALAYKTPRLDTHSRQAPKLLKFCYKLQTSSIWQIFLWLFSFVFMYMIAINLYPETVIQIAMEIGFLSIFWFDVMLEIYHKKFEVLRLSSRFQSRFYFRIVILSALFIDQIAYFVSEFDKPIRPFLVLRCFLPLFYDSTSRKAFESIINSYKDISVYIFFYSLVIISWAVVAHQIIEIPEGTPFDQYAEDYGSFGKVIFIIYVLSSYDNFPDNQLIAIRSSIYIYAFFIAFIILNVLFFVTIPTTIIYNSFRQTRSKTLLIDEIKQQHSLIMAFVSLGQQSSNLSISQNKLIRFLLYVYKKKVRYVDYITEICLKLDDNGNGVINVNQFMQLCKILQANSSMLPPTFNDWGRWLQFRRYLNDKLKLKIIVLSKPFKIFISIFIIFTFINCILAIYTEIEAFDIIDNIFMILYCLEIVLKIVALGPQNYFSDPWNKLDFLLITVGLILQIAPENTVPKNADILFKMTRIFRVTILIKLLTPKSSEKSEVFIKAKRMISQIAIIIPIVNKFMPIYLISYYVLGVLGMQIFQNLTQINPKQTSPYGEYQQFSNFQSFFGTQFLLVQVLVEAGWSEMAFDYAYRFGGYPLVMLFFVICHLLIVIVLSSLLKGIAWEVYSAVHDQFNERKLNQQKIEIKQQNLQKKKEQFEEIRAKIDLQQLLLPNNLITRELYENKIDIEIFKTIKNLYQRNSLSFSRKDRRKRSQVISHIMEDRNIMMDQIFDSRRNLVVDQLDMDNQSESIGSDKSVTITKLMQSLNLQDIQDLAQQDIEEQMEKVLSKIILHHKITYFEATVYPYAFVQFLEYKLKNPSQNNKVRGFDIDRNTIANKDSINFFAYQLNVLLGIEKSEREQKTVIIKNMVNEGILTEQESVRILTKKLNDRNSNLDSNWIMRKMFLRDTNELLIKKFEVQYFSSIYGRSFKQINKLTIQPLLKLESSLTYCLSNALRYPQLNDEQFFTILSAIQDSMSNQLLKKGSLFKFVYQINGISQNWFSIELRQSKQFKVHFLKSGLWIYNKSMKPNQIKYAHDIFCWNFEDRDDRAFCEKYIKRFFQSFQSLAFCLLNENSFFDSDPHQHIYDLFTFYKDVSNNQREVGRKLSIGKIMMIILSKQEQRQQVLNYQLTDIKRENNEQEKQKTNLMFKFDESQNETFNKLKKMELMDHEKIVETEGLPFAYIINMMTEIRNILDLYENNFVYQIQKILNKQFQQIQ